MEIDLTKKLNLIQGDCLEVLKQLPDKSIDLILSTGVASLKNQRKFIGIELDQNYFNIASKRCKEWENQARLI